MKNLLLPLKTFALSCGMLFLVSSFLFNACVPARKAMYFPDLAAGQIEIDSLVRESAKKVYPGDRIILTILTGDAETNQLLNAQGNNTESQGLLIDRDGFVQVPFLGSIAVKGLTPTEIRDIVQLKLSELFKQVFVTCTISGRVIVLNSIGTGSTGGAGGSGGGVAAVTLTDERLTLLELLSTMRTANLKIDKAWIIREVDGKRITAPINFNSKDIFTSPYYYLRNNDVVYIEPNKINQFLEVNAPSRNLLGVVTGLTGLFLSLIVLLK
jgi:polysaccharide export outer membrane protein